MSAASLANLKRGGNPAPTAGSPDQPSRKHGAYAVIAREQLDAKQHEVFEALAADAPLRDSDGGLPAADAMVVHLLARCLIRLERVEQFHEAYGDFDLKTKQPRPSVELERRLRSEALDLAKELGMTPRSRVALGIDVQRSFDLARHWAEQA
jgi:hypothetical protein